MSRDHKYTEEFPKAFKTAMSFAAKYRKKDKEYAYKEDAEEFINEFKMVIIEEVENYILEGTEKTYGKAVSLSKKIVIWILKIMEQNYFMPYYVH